MDTMSDNRQKSCEERIAGELADRLEFIGETWNALDKAEESDEIDEAYETLDTLPLSIDKSTVYKILLSTGGPADWFEATVDGEGSIVRIEYVFQDWFDGARCDVDFEQNENDPIYRLCSYYIEALNG